MLSVPRRLHRPLATATALFVIATAFTLIGQVVSAPSADAAPTLPPTTLPPVTLPGGLLGQG